MHSMAERKTDQANLPECSAAADRKRADDAQRLLAAIVESSDDAIVCKTLTGIIQSWNTGA
ncbi:MAG TPA: hypothetical protein VKH44_13660, partial [Pirellulaceae bacterium]|nr:hypothetical protein [Pirellulaceae bacterium]